MEDQMTLGNVMAIARDQETTEAYELFVADVKFQMRKVENLSQDLKNAKQALTEMEFIPPTI